MEVSSHALIERIMGCPFDVAVFTNLTQDRIFHRDMEDYAAESSVV